MDKTPFFTVIIPTYNRAELLRKCLKSLHNQTFKDFEVLICDDGSIDHTKDVVETFTNQLNIRYHWEPNWGGPARPRNIGIQMATGEWICFLDADDTWHPEKLSIIFVRIQLSGRDVYFHKFFVRKKNGWKRGTSKLPPNGIYSFLITEGSTLFHSSMVIRRSLLTSVNGFSEKKELIALEDYDLLLRIARVTDNFELVNQYLGYYDSGEDSITNHNETRIVKIGFLFDVHIAATVDPRLKSQANGLRCYLIARTKHLGTKDRSCLKDYRTAWKQAVPSIRKKAVIFMLLWLFKR